MTWVMSGKSESIGEAGIRGSTSAGIALREEENRVLVGCKYGTPTKAALLGRDGNGDR